MSIEQRHPSYGMIGASRWTAGGKGVRLFASRLPGHNSGVTIRIHDARVSFDLGHETVSSGGRTLAEVTVSPVQWAEFLTAMNVGDGVPCTLGFIAGDTSRREPPPAMESEPERVRVEFGERIHGSVKAIREAREKAREAVGGKVTRAVAKEIDDAFGRAEQELASNAPWYVQQFHEATDRVANAVRAELDAFLTTAATKLGLKSLAEGGMTMIESHDGGGE